MSAALYCPKCGAPLPAKSPHGLCPACLVKLGLESRSASEVPTGADAGGGQFDPALAATIDHRPGAAPDGPLAERALPEPGERFGGYYILRTLGKGGMGAVYEADQLETGRRVALKVLKHSLDSPEARKRFLREGRLAASVNHPNSVYVYGTEEIDGTPAIAMELIAGGTLQQRLKEHGPLPIGAAVDTILQIMAGLEAAQKLGVLHRDIKPANCFIDADGTVKVGDFGLSISTAARGDTDLTQSGTLLGTPAFSSPEQLRGDELNIRSDIYSVGVTLYYLLTGRTPFEADNMVKLLATVLEQSAPSPRKWRPEIQRPLAAVVLRCLEKQPTDRFRDYAELRQALLPFASAAPTPATVGLRVLASAVDGAIVKFLLTLLNMLMVARLYQTTSLSLNQGWWWAASVALYLSLRIAYYAVPEGLWGLSPGKALCRLRVMGRDRAAPGVMRAAARAAIILVGAQLPSWIVPAVVELDPTRPFPVLLFAAGLMLWGPLWGMLLFITARRTNGYAALHDLVTGTRVISREPYQVRAARSRADDLPAVSADTPRIGPYHVLKTLEERDGEEWLLGYDTRLLRRVWIHKVPAGTEPVDASLRSVGRIGRLRWLAGRRSPAESWDAYEAASGQALVTLLHRRQPWNEVRFWLLDLAEELAAASREGTVPSRLVLDRVWITDEGRAKLLDFAAPGIEPSPDNAGEPAAATGDIGIARQFLIQIATAALEGRMISAAETRSPVPLTPLPLRARGFLLSLATIPSAEAALPPLRELLQQPSAASRARRLSLLLASCVPPLAIVAMFFLSLLMAAQIKDKYPDFQPLFMHLMALEQLQRGESHLSLKGTAEEKEALERYIAFRFHSTLQNQALMSGFPANWKALAQKVMVAHPHVTEAEFHAAEKILEPLERHYDEIAKYNPSLSQPKILSGVAAIAAFIYLALVAILSLAAAILWRGGLLLWSLGLAVVRSDGVPASRLRVLWRALIAWSPVLIAPFVAAFGLPALRILLRAGSSSVAIGAATLLAILYLSLVAWSALLPGRGIPDRLAGTWLVPR